MPTQAPPAGYYQDPDDPDMKRYWDGAKWTQMQLPMPLEYRIERATRAGSGQMPVGPTAISTEAPVPTPPMTTRQASVSADAAQATLSELQPSGYAIASLCCGFCGIGPLAILFYLPARTEIARNEKGGSGIAMAGLILGIIACVGLVLLAGSVSP